MKKHGFTLAEVLVTLAIIGVVASIVMPMTINNTKKNQTGAILGRAVEQFELGCQNYVQDQNIKNMEAGSVSYSTMLYPSDKDITISKLLKYVGAEPSTVSNTYSFQKFGATFTADKQTVAAGGGSSPDTPLFTLTFDTNGSKGPNAYATDKFEFDLLNSCKMRPAGYADYSSCPGSSDTTKKTCAAKVVADGFKITY